MSGHLIPDRQRPGAYFVRISGTDQSYVDPDDPLYLEFDYVSRIADVIDCWRPAPQRIRTLHIGGGGMTIPRWLASTRPTSAQIVLEPDQELIDEVRALVALPPRSGIKVRPVDGRSGIVACKDADMELIIVDAFDGGQVPGELATVEWFTHCGRVLTDSGLLIMNVTDKTPFEFSRRAVQALRQQLPTVAIGAEPALLKGRRFGNLVVVASRTELPMSQLNRKAAGSAFPYRWLDPVSVIDWVGKIPVFTDDDQHPSPRPITSFISR